MKNILYVLSAAFFFLAIVVAYFSASYFSASCEENFAGSLGYQLGKAAARSLKLMLFVYPIWRFGIVNRFGLPKRGHILICYFGLFLFCSSYFSFNMYTDAKFITKIKVAMANLSNDLINNDPQSIVRPVFSVEEYGEFTPLLNRVSDSAVSMAQEARKIDKASAVCFTEELFEVKQMCDPDALQLKIDALGVFEEELNNSQDRFLKIIETQHSDIEMLAKKHFIDSKAFFDGYHQGLKKQGIDLENLYPAPRKLVHAMKEFFQFLQSAKGQYDEEDGRIVFETDEQIETFNKLFGQIIKIIDPSAMDNESLE